MAALAVAVSVFALCAATGGIDPAFAAPTASHDVALPQRSRRG